MITDNTPMTPLERALAGLTCLIGAAAIAVCCAILCAGCAYKGGKVVDGTNLAIGMTIPGTEWQINALDYVGGLRVAGNDMTTIAVSNEVDESGSYFGVVTTHRKTRMTAEITPTETSSGEAEAGNR